MKKIYAFISLLLTSGMIMLMLSACTQNNPNSQFSNNSQVSADLPNGYILHEMIFPESDAEKTDYNKDIFEITPFKIQVAFPEKWSIGEFDSQKNTYLYSGTWARVGIYDEDNKCIGAVGYNIFEIDEEAEDELMAVYNQIALGNDYRFDVKNTYTVVKESDTSETATTDIYYSPVFSTTPDSEGVSKTNYGILSYNSDKLVYGAFEFDSAVVSDDTITCIANSVEFLD